MKILHHNCVCDCDTLLKCWYTSEVTKYLWSAMTVWMVLFSPLTVCVIMPTWDTTETVWSHLQDVYMSVCILIFVKVIVGDRFDTTPEHSPSSECPSVHSCFTLVFITLPLHPLCLLCQWVLFLSHWRVSTVIPVVPLLPGDSDRGKQCLPLLWLHNGRCASFVL